MDLTIETAYIIYRQVTKYIISLSAIFLLGIGFLAWELYPVMEEICNDGIDNDDDGFVDVFDPDCSCMSLVGLVPNPDFEQSTGCCEIIGSIAQNCLSNWQLLEGSPDLYNPDCTNEDEIESIESSFISPFTSTFLLLGSDETGIYSESMAVCLSTGLLAGETYQYSIRIALPDALLGQGEPDVSFAVYGISSMADCNDLTSSIGMSDQSSCSTLENLDNQKLFSVTSQSLKHKEWTTVDGNFVADTDMNIIILNADCDNGDGAPSLFYLIDEVQIYFDITDDFFDENISMSNLSCIDPVTLSLPKVDTLSFQWYKDSILIDMQTDNSLDVSYPIDTGLYHAFVIDRFGNCNLIGPIELFESPIESFDTTTICNGFNYQFGIEDLTEEGDYMRTTLAHNGCDSIIHLRLNVDPCTGNEDCHNNRDDDGDGLIDGFDDDCDCPEMTITKRYVKNPNFDDHSSCCDNLSFNSFNCIDSWEPLYSTPDYYHLDCSDSARIAQVERDFILEFDEPFMFIRTNNYINPNRNVSESFGACLREPLMPGQAYNIEIIASLQPTSRDTIDSGLSLYGLTGEFDCENLATEIGSLDTVFCQSALFDQSVLIQNIENRDLFRKRWRTFNFTYTATEEISVILFNVFCQDASVVGFSNYLISRVQISRVLDTSLDINPNIHLDRAPCHDPVVLSVEQIDSFSYQWYHDSVPILEETSSTLNIPLEDAEGDYSVYVYGEEGCILLGPYPITISTPVTNDTVIICQHDTYNFGDQNLSASGDYMYTFTSQSLCDSIVHLHLIVLEILEGISAVQLCQGEVYQFNNQNYTEAGTYTDTLVSVDGCDSIDILHLSLVEYVRETRNIGICEGENYNFYDNEITVSGVYMDTILVESSCDSIITLALDVLPYDRASIQATICENEVYLFHNRTLTQAGIYIDTVSNPVGCDSIVSLDLRVDSYQRRVYSQFVCEGSSYNFYGHELDQSGTYIDTFGNNIGCDSIVELRLNIDSMIEAFINDEICEDEEYIFGSEILTTEGIYESHTTSVDGCDSTTYLDLTVHPNSYGDTTYAVIDEGSVYSFEGMNYRNAGFYEVVINSSQNCDSLVYLDLLVEPLLRIYLPNVITPNSHDHNSVFSIHANKEILVESYRIYDRWGKLLYFSTDFELPGEPLDFWNGRWHGDAVVNGVYVYKIIYLDDKNEKQELIGDFLVL